MTVNTLTGAGIIYGNAEVKTQLMIKLPYQAWIGSQLVTAFSKNGAIATFAIVGSTDANPTQNLAITKLVESNAPQGSAGETYTVFLNNAIMAKI